MKDDQKGFFDRSAGFRQPGKDSVKPEKRPIQPSGTGSKPGGSGAGNDRNPGENRLTPPGVPGGTPSEAKKLEPGMTGTLIKDANLKYDSYGSGRPDGQPTQTLKAGTAVTINNVVANPAAGQTHTVHVNGVGWIQADAIRV